jgi:hypothetical protein
MSHRVVVLVGVAVLISAYSAPLAQLFSQALQGLALLVIVFLAFWLMLVAPFRDR